MSTYYNIDISHNLFSEIEWAIIQAIKHEKDVYEVIDKVHLLDTWYELQEEASAENGRELQKWRKQQEFLEKKEFDDIFLFHEIQDVIKDYIELDIENEFHLICDISEILKNKMSDKE